MSASYRSITVTDAAIYQINSPMAVIRYITGDLSESDACLPDLRVGLESELNRV